MESTQLTRYFRSINIKEMTSVQANKRYHRVKLEKDIMIIMEKVEFYQQTLQTITEMAVTSMMKNIFSLSMIVILTSVRAEDWVTAAGKTPGSFIFSGGSVDKQGRKIYVCRAKIQGEMASGTVSFLNGHLGQCELPFGGKEISTSHYEVLISPPWDEYELKWSGTINIFGKIPSGSVKVGPGTYVGRYKENNHHFLGKVKYEHIARLFFYTVNNREYFRKRGYQVLVKKSRPIKRYEILDIKYDLSQASQILSPEYVTLAHKSITNDSPYDTTSTLSIEITDSTTSEWSVTAGLELYAGISTSVTAGIPSLGDVTGGWQIGVTSFFSYTTGKSFTSSAATAHEVSVDLPPHSSARVAVIAKKAIVDVPYTATVRVVFKNGHTFINRDVKGVYKDVHHTSFETSVENPSAENDSNSGTASNLVLRPIMMFELLVMCLGIFASV